MNIILERYKNQEVILYLKRYVPFGQDSVLDGQVGNIIDEYPSGDLVIKLKIPVLMGTTEKIDKILVSQKEVIFPK
mgnify:CR=1 FL=1